MFFSENEKQLLINKEFDKEKHLSLYNQLEEKGDFTAPQIITIITQGSGKKNLEALEKLLQGLVDSNGDALMDSETEQQSTYISVLKKAGFDSQMLASVLDIWRFA